jgi:hypothetical protein
MKHFPFLTVIFIFILAASACSVVTVMEPIGENPVQLQPKEWEGLWKLYLCPIFDDDEEEETFFLIEVADGENGVLKVQNIGRKPESVQVYLRESNDWMFGSFKDPDHADKGFDWGRFKKNGDRVVIWGPDYDHFSDLVNEELLPGHPYAGEQQRYDKFLILSDLKPEHMKLITSDSNGDLFNWEYPSFMVRVSDDID